MKQVVIGPAGVEVAEVPAPTVSRGGLLIAVAHSCISVGTEMSGVRASNLSLWQRALHRPDQVRKVVTMVRRQGIARTRSLVRNQLETFRPLGYSAAGVVLEVGDDIADFSIGDRVACAGSQAAFHAEVISVPQNLCCHAPGNVTLKDASTVALGAIALQGVRRLSPTLGECFVVIGLGLIGQLTGQILRASGCRVIGSDPDQRRVTIAQNNGAIDVSLETDEHEPEQQAVARLTEGVGADGVVVTAATADATLLNSAFSLCRRKGRVVLVGDVPISIDRSAVYEKELDFLISTSYGPGRYDRGYEEAGLDYPIGFVRWTEGRNMQAYLQMLGSRRVSVDSLVEADFDVANAVDAYAALASPGKPLAVVLNYPAPVGVIDRTIEVSPRRWDRSDKLRLAVIGPGGFFQSTLLPCLENLGSEVHIVAVASRQGHVAHSIAKRMCAEIATTSIDDVLLNPAVDAVMIATRHDSHGGLVLRALQAGKAVFVEKPLCLTPKELADIQSFFAANSGAAPLLLTGFNRRFSPAAQLLKENLMKSTGPVVLSYHVNAGYIEQTSWVHSQEGGGRNLGEACHFYDLFTYLTQSRALDVKAVATRPRGGMYQSSDNFAATISFADGSVASLVYTSMGSARYPKERLVATSGGQTLVIDDYVKLEKAGVSKPLHKSSMAEKGHRQELQAFVRAVRGRGEWPIELWEQVQATQIALDVERQIR